MVFMFSGFDDTKFTYVNLVDVGFNFGVHVREIRLRRFEMVHTMFTNRAGRVILDKGTLNDDVRRVRPTASARAHHAQHEQRRLRKQQAEEAQPEEVQAEETQQDEADDGYPGGPVDRSVLRTYGDHVATRLWDGVDREELRVFSNGKKLKEAIIENEELQDDRQRYNFCLCREMASRHNSFHLPIGEMIITLDGVSSLLHIPITGAFFSVSIFNKDDAAKLLGELLGRPQLMWGYAWGVVALAYLYDNLREASMHQTGTVSGYLTLLQVFALAFVV
uniref:Uncharacterized protein LOC101502559 n=1 Tax=Cicer arietinum TaxID=3827 RepID=A0A1S3E6D3_CICAR|nr:uncharacterized protein LOC101502559 [Cicer arietinum]